MKILVVAPTPFFSDRGTHIRILEEARALEKLGHKITIATYHIGRDIDTEIQTTIDVRRIRRLIFWYHKLDGAAGNSRSPPGSTGAPRRRLPPSGSWSPIFTAA